MNRILRRILPLFVFAALLAAPSAMAQYWTPAESQTRPAEAHGFTNDEIASYADTYVALEAVRSDFASQLRDADDPEETAAIQQNFQSAVAEVMAKSEIGSDRYNELTVATQSDQRLNERLLNRIQRVREARSRR